MLSAYEWSLDRVLRLQVDHADGDAVAPSPARSGSTSWCRRASSRPKTPATSSASPRRNTDIVVPGAWSSCSARSPISCARIRRSPTSIPRSAPAAPIPSATAAACWSRSSRATSAASCRPVIWRGCGKNANIVAGIADLLPADPEHQSRRQAGRRASISTRCNPTTPTRCIGWRRKCATRSPSSRRCATSPPTSTSRIRRSPSRSTARKRRSTASPSIRSARSSTTPSASRQVATIYTPANDYQVILETKPEFQTEPERPGARLSQDHQRHRGAAVGGHAFRAARSGRCRSTTRASSRR